MLHALTTYYDCWKESGIYMTPHYIFCFVKGVMLKLKSLMTYDVIFEYFLGTAHILNTFILSFTFKSLKFWIFDFFNCANMEFFGYLIK
jgi:hypothetical protein